MGTIFSAPLQTGLGAHPAACTMRTVSFPEDKSGWSVTLIPHPLLVSFSRKSRAIPLLPLWGRTACTEPQCLYSIAIHLLPLWAVRPVQSLSACTVSYTSTPPMGRTVCTYPQCLYSIAIPLLPLRVVRPVQSLSAC